MKITLRSESCAAQYYQEDLDSSTTLDMILIPGGNFMMGSPDHEPERYDDESPQHNVKVPTFFMGKTPVTQKQWRAVAALPEIKHHLDPNPSEFSGDDRPVEQVSWHEAVEFCARLAKKSRRPYRLPNEAEWEYACRAMTSPPTQGNYPPFHFGAIITPDLVNYNWTESYQNSPTKSERSSGTTLVGTYPPNAFGLYDMHGQVWEWCEDDWHSNYEGAPTDGSAWVNKSRSETDRRVVRGGSWINDPRYCRSADRFNYLAGARYYDVGFRVSCSAPRTL
ncbi:formylglycine-generating enzyme family protein [Merismopedia glauca]|uniref:Formylglycine-generating enzyme family protein n=1 Tax=Merismopedia glauca CCAP 1448/3 TaxID=1296344 RepID=A0A2T1C3E0_9CYAN|nr:formylglycine-generating enzyme family protein [Merismopedia glauca]PSB02782.1 formylglycine-generating enzyme family protein [Merismopedia glauca CCAP 1448/3]